MNVTKTIQDKTTVILKIELLPDELKPHIERATKRVSKAVKVPGFRPGHVPYDVLIKHVSEMEIYQEAVDDILQDTLPTVVQREKVEFVGKPAVAVETLAPGNPMVYTATFALMPSVDAKNYKTVKVKKNEVKIDDAKVKKTMEDLRKMRSKTEPVERAAEKGDQVTIDFDITQGGVPFEGGQGKAVPVTLGEGYFIPGFEEQLTGMKAAETKKFKITFPKDYSAKHLAGKECDVTATVKAVNKMILPELDDAFAKELNFASLIELTEQITGNIKLELVAKADQEYEAAVIEKVVEQASFDPIPQLMIEYELDRMFEELQQQVEEQGAKMEDYLQHIKKTKEELRTTWKEHADKRIKSALVIKVVAEQENITVPEEEITAEQERRKAAYKESPETLKQLESMEYRGYLRTTMRNQKALEKMKDYANGKTAAAK